MPVVAVVTDGQSRVDWRNLRGRECIRGTLGFQRCSLCKRFLMSLSLGMRHIISFIGVERQAQLALELPSVQPLNIRILGQVERLHCKLAQTLSTSDRFLLTVGDAKAASLSTGTVLKVHDG